MKKLFISQPMRGKSAEEIQEERKGAVSAAREALGEEVDVIDTYFGNFDGNALQFLGKSLMFLATADIAYFAPGWQDARGCKIEHDCAIAYGIPCIETGVERRSGLSFGQAIEAAKTGMKIAREGWNGKTQYVELATSISYVNARGDIVNALHEAIGNKALAFVGTSGVQMGWLASQSDMLAEDWKVVDDLA